MENAILTPLGKEVKRRLVGINRIQARLIKQVQGTTGLYFNRSYMHKIQTGQLATPKIVQTIRGILDLPEQRRDTEAEE